MSSSSSADTRWRRTGCRARPRTWISGSDHRPTTRRECCVHSTGFGAPRHGLTAADLESEGTIYQVGVPPNRVDLITTVDGVEFTAVWRDRAEIHVDNQMRGTRAAARRCRAGDTHPLPRSPSRVVDVCGQGNRTRAGANERLRLRLRHHAGERLPALHHPDGFHPSPATWRSTGTGSASRDHSCLHGDARVFRA
jgi:hypothetical protein